MGHVQANAAGHDVMEQHNSDFRNLASFGFAAFTAEAGLAKQPARRHRGARSWTVLEIREPRGSMILNPRTFPLLPGFPLTWGLWE
jgi:hypothetical protein